MISKRTKVVLMICAAVVVTASMVLAKMGLIPVAVFYCALGLMHAWIFTKIGIRLYKLKKNTK